jgi:O-antigen ligase
MARAGALPAARWPGPGAILTAVLAIFVVLAFAWRGPAGAPGVVALGIVGLALLFVLPVAWRVLLLAGLGAFILLPQAEAGVHPFDPVPLLLGGLAIGLALLRGERAEWNVTLPGWLTLGWLAAPWVGVPFVVVSMASFLAAWKNQVVFAFLFHGLRRVVPRAHSHGLLAIFPILGTIAAIQLLLKTQGLGAFLFDRMSFRNFYTRLPWGQSDFISAVIEFCICGTVLLFFVVRRTWIRVLLAGAILVMLNAFLILFSRAGVISLALFALIVAMGLGGRKGWLALGGTLLAAAGAALATAGGQATAGRFTDPHELGSVVYRLVIWSVAWGRVVLHPWTGTGLNQGKFQHDLQGAEWASNFLLDVLIESGVIGGIVFVAILVGLFVVASRIRPHGWSGSPRPVRAVAIGCLVQALAHGSVESTLVGPPMTVPFIYFMAWLLLQDERDPAAVPR